MTGRRVLLVAHTGREHAVEVAREAHRLLTSAGIGVRVLADEAESLGLEPVEVADDPDKAALDVELIVVLGGDGSICAVPSWPARTAPRCWE